jgi:hypothetical protein
MKTLIHSKDAKKLSKKEQCNVHGGYFIPICKCLVNGRWVDWNEQYPCPDHTMPLCNG